MGKRHARRNDDRFKFFPRPVFRMLAAIFRIGDFVARLTIFVERKNLGTRFRQRFARRDAGNAEAEDAEFLLLYVRDQDHLGPTAISRLQGRSSQARKQ